MYVFDVLYLVDILLSIVYKSIGWMESKRYYKPRPVWMILIDVLSTIPYEVIYNELWNSESVRLYFLLKLRYLLRLYRIIAFALDMRRSVGLSNLALSLFEMIIGFFLFLLLMTLILCVSYEPEEFGTENIGKIMSYLFYKTVGYGYELLETPPIFLFVDILPFSIFVFLQYCFGISCTTCALLQSYRPKMIFANSLSLWKTFIKSSFKGSNKEAILTALNTYALHCWKKREKLSTDYEYDKIITNTMRLEIKLDLCFNALKHSNLFRALSTNILRHMSSLMCITFMTPGELIYGKQKYYATMVYVVTGTIQLLSQEDGETPILSLSGGTVLGETSLFFSHPCPCTVICQSYCEVILLQKDDFMRITSFYPDLYSTLLDKVKSRYLEARLYVYILNYQLRTRESKEKREVLTLKWLKSISKKLYRKSETNITELDNIHDRKHAEIFKQCAFVTYYLDQIVFTEDIELNTQAIMYKKTFPFVFLHNTIVGWLWDQMIAGFALINATFYIFYVCTAKEHYGIYSFITTLISILWVMDVYLQSSTAIKTKDLFITKVTDIIIIKIKSLAFWMDIFAAMPVDVIILLIVGPVTVQAQHLFQCNRLLKSYRLFQLFSTTDVHNPSKIVKYIKIRYVMTMLLAVANISGILFLLSCYNFKCNPTFENFLTDIRTQFGHFTLKLVVCFYLACALVSGVTFGRIPISAVYAFLVLQFLKLLSQIYFTAELTAIRALRNDYVQKNSELKQSIVKVCKVWKIDERITRRMVDFMDIYLHEKAMTQGLAKLSNQLPRDMYKIAVRRFFGNLQEYLPILKNLPEDVTSKINTTIYSMIIPPNEVVIYFGEVCKEMYIIEAGCCRIHYACGLVSKLLGPGDTFCVYETCKRIPAMTHVVTVTHCKVLTLQYNDYVRAFLFHPDILKQTKDVFMVEDKVTEMEDNTDLQDSDRIYTQDVPSFKVFGYNMTKGTDEAEDFYPIYEQNTALSYLKYFMLRVTFRCGGKFMFYWEISRCVFALLSVLLFPMALTTLHQYRFLRYPLLFLDFTAYADIYVRLHITYYDKKNIEIMHPLKTASYYCFHGLLMDFLGVAPINLVIPVILRMKPNAALQIVLKLNRLIQYYRIHLFFSKMAKEKGKRSLHSIRYFILIAYVVNVCASLLVISNCDHDDNFPLTEIFYSGVQCEPTSFLTPKDENTFETPVTAFKIQCLAIYFVTSIICGQAVEGFKLLNGVIFIEVSILGLIGIFAFIYLTALIVSSYLLRNVDLIIFQSSLYQLVKFLNYRKIDNKLCSEVIEHFEYMWRKKRGKNEQKLFQMFNSALEEDILYEMYGKILHSNAVFMGASKSFYKSLLHYVTHRVYLNMGIVTRVNECHSDIYFLIKGTIDVLGPDYNHLLYLPIGSMFGSLDIGLMRQTLTMVCKGHVEVLVIENKVFHSILSRYKLQRAEYEQLTYIHTDYLLGKGTDENIVTESSIEVEKKLRSKFHIPKMFRKVYHGKYIKIWKVFILLVVCYVGFTVELYQKSSWDMNFYMITYLYITDVLFMINIYLKFHTPYHNEYGIEVNNLNLISRRYLKRQCGFWMDFLTIIPFELFAFIATDPDYFEIIFTYGRLNRLPRIIHVINYFEAINNKLHINVLLMRLLYLMAWVTVVLQVMTNIFFFLVSMNDPTLEYYNIHVSKRERVTTYMNQIVMVVFMATGTSINDFLPNDCVVLIFTSLQCIALKFLLIRILAEVCATIEVISYHKTQYESDIHELKKSMILDDLAIPLQDRAWLYVKLLWIYSRGNSYPDLLSESPYYLKQAILNSMFGYHIRKHPVLKHCHVDFIKQLIAYFETRVYVAGDYITFIGDIDGCMYFIQEGEVLEIIKETIHTQLVRKVLHSGEMFGFRQGIYERCGHKYTYKANTYCFVLELKRERWIHLLNFFPASEFVIFNAVEYLKVDTED